MARIVAQRHGGLPLNGKSNSREGLSDLQARKGASCEFARREDDSARRKGKHESKIDAKDWARVFYLLTRLLLYTIQ